MTLTSLLSCSQWMIRTMIIKKEGAETIDSFNDNLLYPPRTYKIGFSFQILEEMTTRQKKKVSKVSKNERTLVCQNFPKKMQFLSLYRKPKFSQSHR